MRRFALSPEAKLDLRNIRGYLLEEAGLVVSRQVMREIAKAIDALAETPGLGHAREDLTDEPVKFWPVYSYLVIYDPASRPLGVARVLHSSRDVQALLLRTPSRSAGG